MASQIIREWLGINSFAPATQTKLLELLGKLNQEVPFYIIFKYSILILAIQIILFFFFVKVLTNFANSYVSVDVECEQFDNSCYGERWGGEIIHCELTHW